MATHSRIIFVFMCAFFFITIPVAGITDNIPVAASSESLNPPPSAPPVRPVKGSDRVLTDSEHQLSIAVLVFGLIALLVQSSLLWKSGFDNQAAIKMSTVTLVIIGTLFVITAGFDSEQIAPAMGLFGTICGYLLGKESGKKDSKNNAS